MEGEPIMVMFTCNENVLVFCKAVALSIKWASFFVLYRAYTKDEILYCP